MAELGTKQHTLSLNNKKSLNITGVLKVDSVNENFASVETSCGRLVICGRDIKMKKLLVEEGIVEMEGDFESFKYRQGKNSGNFFKRIFK